jgi:ABC-type oligopeptide transport system ATPase subunit
MCRGEVVERGDTERVLERPEHEYTIALVSSIVELWSDGPAVSSDAPRG